MGYHLECADRQEPVWADGEHFDTLEGVAEAIFEDMKEHVDLLHNKGASFSLRSFQDYEEAEQGIGFYFDDEDGEFWSTYHRNLNDEEMRFLFDNILERVRSYRRQEKKQG